MKTDGLKIYRRRYIPDELLLLDKDEILYLDDNLLVTRWKTIHPRPDFASGISAFFMDKGWKISRILNSNGEIVHWYCDIIDVIKNEEENSITYEDLLFDVVVSTTGRHKVLDTDEAADAFEQGLITKDQLLHAMRCMHELLTIIYSDRFDRLQSILDSYDAKDDNV